MEELGARLKSWQTLSFSLSGVIFIIFLILFVFNFNIVFSNSNNKKINLEDVQIIAVKATNSAKSRVAIYKEKRKIFTAPCLEGDDLCDLVGFAVKIDAKKITGVQQSKSNFFINEIYFKDGTIYKNLEVEQAKILIEIEQQNIVRSFVVFLGVSFVFFILGFVLLLFRRKLCLNRV